MKFDFLDYGFFLISILIFGVGISIGNSAVTSGIEVYLLGICSMILLLMAAKFECFPFAKNKKIVSRMAFCIWILFLAGTLMVGGSSLMARYFGSEWLKLLFFIILVFGKPVSTLYPQILDGWWSNSSKNKN